MRNGSTIADNVSELNFGNNTKAMRNGVWIELSGGGLEVISILATGSACIAE